MAVYFQKSNGDLIPKSCAYAPIQVLQSSGTYVVCVGGFPISDDFAAESEARILQSKIAAKLIEGGDTILIIDDF